MSISSHVELLQHTQQYSLPKNIQEDIMHAFFYYLALTDTKYEFYCTLCGYYPTILNFDLCKNTVADLHGEFVVATIKIIILQYFYVSHAISMTNQLHILQE